ncbi:hypothetical protein Q7P37_000961 [Cladosporium fusiforme]
MFAFVSKAALLLILAIAQGTHQSYMPMSSTKTSFPLSSNASDLELPVPKLELDFKISVQLNPRINVGKGPWGDRNWISFSGGEWNASWGQGTVEPGGQDSQLVVNDTLHTYVDTNYLLITNDEEPAYITVQTAGWRTGPREVLEKLFDPEQADDVLPSEYSFRLTVKLETGDERYKDVVNSGMWIGSGARKGSEVVYDGYRIL